MWWKKIKDKLTLLDDVSKVETLATSSSLSTPLSIDQLLMSILKVSKTQSKVSLVVFDRRRLSWSR